ncbi:MAG: LacI family transcriptional regulator [Amaricoccus sp.]|uniref:LacI family transcriptional regulator n=1 Tax=Amaricoccus sp. TaxID=1872485 RepID=UPI0039E71D28
MAAGEGRDGSGAPRDAAGRPTLKTIAYMTGLGVTTVSRALHDAPDIGQATKERVRLVASQIGYRPNRAGVRLRTGKTSVISLILSVETEVLGPTSHLVYGISERLAGSPYHLIVTPYNPRNDPLDPLRYIVETASADGIIFSRTEPRDARVRYLHEHGLPFATHGRTDMGLSHPFHDFDNARYAEIAVERLAARGRRRLAFLPPPGNLTYGHHMTAGFERAVDRLDLADVAMRDINTDSGHRAIEDEVTRMMASPRRRPDGFVCGSANAAIAVIGAAEAAGYAIGRDFDLAVKDSFRLMPKFRSDIIAVHEDFRAAGHALADAVVRTLDGVAPEELQTIEVPPGP